MIAARRFVLIAASIAGVSIAAFGDWIAARAAARLGKLSARLPERVR